MSHEDLLGCFFVKHMPDGSQKVYRATGIINDPAVVLAPLDGIGGDHVEVIGCRNYQEFNIYRPDKTEAALKLESTDHRSTLDNRLTLAAEPECPAADQKTLESIEAVSDEMDRCDYDDAVKAELLRVCKMALAAFEHNHCINWDELADAIRAAEAPTAGLTREEYRTAIKEHMAQIRRNTGIDKIDPCLTAPPSPTSPPINSA